jgi:hypothetical protein
MITYYVQYLDVNPITGQLYDPCGDRSIVRLDARNNLHTMIADGHRLNGFRRPKYPAFKIMYGNSLLHLNEITGTIQAED